MKITLLALSLLFAAQAPAATQPADVQIDVGRAEWSRFPALTPAPRNLPVETMTTRVESMLRERQCELQGQTWQRFDITVPWLVQVDPDGRLSRVLIADMGCRALETYVASLVVALAHTGGIRPQTGAEPRWYGSEFNFNLRTVH